MHSQEGRGTPAPTTATGEASGEFPSLRDLAIHGSFWVLFGYGAQQCVRLASTLILTRLLFPEAYGLMALVQAMIQGLQTLSDTGINAGVIRHRRGEEKAFVDTAWTLQALRGIVLWILATLLAWPMASFYDQEALLLLIPVVGLTCVMAGLRSPAFLRLGRQVRVGPVVLRELCARVIGLGVMIACALWWPSVWVLAGGALVFAGLSSAFSYVGISDSRARWHWDRDAVRQLFQFGRWILVATIFTLVVNQGDKIVLGKMLTSTDLGVYAVAAIVCQMVVEAVSRVDARVLFPIYSQAARQGPGALRRRVHRARFVILCVSLPPLWLCAVFGPQAIGLLYDSRYSDAGWMLQILAVGAVGTVLGLTGNHVLLAVGDSRRFMLLQVIRAVLLLGCVAVGGLLGGIHGMLLGLATSRFLAYPFVAWAIHRYDAWSPKLDLFAFALSALVIAWGRWICLV